MPARSLVFERGVDQSARRGYAGRATTLLYEEPITARTKWIIRSVRVLPQSVQRADDADPGCDDAVGRRIYFQQLKHRAGDGWNNVSRIEAYHDKQTISAEVVERELIAPYPDLAGVGRRDRR